ncbi:MAG: YggS family pyridoxal phosphate-dependent enzyme [Oscillospiraceae bacterium]|jgi:pyridoxal phosphate enzyme (YggS family)|nr:YggS family pyridoxal phosphate-dependent enzyme [Oscillospiraceae bacterium]
MEITENVIAVKERIAKAAALCGRDPSEIALVAASKMNSADKVKEAVLAGVDACGENRVQELLEKYEQGAYEGAPLHFIGTLQKNKVKYLVGKVSLIHSVDSFSLLQEIEKQAARRDLVQDVLLEINIAGEDSKSGMEASRLPEILEMAAPLEHVRILGLMAIPPICSDPEENRPYFAKMRQLFVDNAGKKYDNSLMKCLSMGMSSDFETAITEGATMVRVGTAIFGRRDYGI